MGGGDGTGRITYVSTRPGGQTAVQQDRGQSLADYQTKPRVFISFNVDDEEQVNLLRYQGANSEQLEFTDYSVKEPFDEQWKAQCTERIRQSSVVVVAIGENTHQRPAVLWEIETAHKLGKPVIGMRIYGDKNHKIPQPMVDYGDKVVEWKLEKLQGEIDKARGATT